MRRRHCLYRGAALRWQVAPAKDVCGCAVTCGLARRQEDAGGALRAHPVDARPSRAPRRVFREAPLSPQLRERALYCAQLGLKLKKFASRPLHLCLQHG